MLGHSHEFDIQHGIIVGEYFIIAIQFFTVFSSVKHKSRGHWAAAFMVGIFTMCAFVGYVVDIIHIPYWFHIAIGFFHIGWTAYFIHKNHAATLISALSKHEREHYGEKYD